MTSENQGELPLSVEKPIAAQSNLPSSNLLFSPDRLTEEEKRIYLQVMDRNWEDQPLFIDNLEHIGDAAKAIALGRPLIVLAPFGNIYGLFGHPAKEVVEAINVAKGRPAEQVGSITTTRENILNMFDLDRLPEGLDKDKVQVLIDAFNVQGPVGFIGPAADHIPSHLASVATIGDQAFRTTQVITPGYQAPFNDFLKSVINHMGTDPNYLFATSANLSHHMTGQEEPAHYRGKPLQQEFKNIGGVVMMTHPDEEAMAQNYPLHRQSSTSIIRLDRLSKDGALLVRRHGSLPIEQINAISQKAIGLPAVLAEGAGEQPTLRKYAHAA